MLICSKQLLSYISVLKVSFAMLNIAAHFAFSFFHPKALALDFEKCEDSAQRRR
jgi:hypothetical protein